VARHQYTSLLLKRKAVSGVTLLVSDFSLRQDIKLPTTATNKSKNGSFYHLYYATTLSRSYNCGATTDFPCPTSKPKKRHLLSTLRMGSDPAGVLGTIFYPFASPTVLLIIIFTFVAVFPFFMQLFT
jgi:hypothetical protein